MTQPISYLTPLNFNSAPAVLQDVPFLKMPSDIVVRFLRHLTPKEIGESALICRQWKKILEQDPVWRGLFYHHFPSISPSIMKNFEHFQNAYKTLCSNLTKGIYTSYTLQEYKTAGEILANPLVVADGKLFSGSREGTVKVRDIHTGECTSILQGDGRWVISLVAADGKLFSGSSNSTIKIWDILTGKCTATLRGHGRWVTSLVVADGKLFSGSRDGTIKVWDIHTGECTATLQGGGRGWVTSLVVADGKLFSGFLDGTIKIWDIHTGECTTTLQRHERSVTSLIVADGKLFLSLDDGTIKILDIHTGECITTLQENEIWVPSPLATAEGKLFSSLLDGTIKIWDIHTGKCTSILQENWNGLIPLSLVVADGKLFSSFDNYTIKVWDFTANHNTIFQEIAESLERGTPEATQQAFERFSRMPNAAKNAIYGKLYEILKPIANDRAEHASYDQYWQQAAPAQQAQAIRDYVSEITIT